MPYGYSKRIYKKKYKNAVECIALKIQKAFKGKRDRKKWISEITNGRMRDLQNRVFNIDFDTRCPKMSHFG